MSLAVLVSRMGEVLADHRHPSFIDWTTDDEASKGALHVASGHGASVALREIAALVRNQ